MKLFAGCLGMLAAAMVSAGFASGQSGGATRFEIATVEAVPNGPDLFRGVLGTAVNGEVRLTNATLLECLRFAFGIGNNFQIVGPDWIHSTEYRFNVFAKAPANTPPAEIRLMLQNLLAERLRIAMHREQRELAYLALMVSKNGLKLREATPGSDASGNRQVAGNIASNSISIAELTSLLSHFLGQPVLNQTGLGGWYDVKLQWTTDAGAPDDLAANAAIFAALEEQLGLTLERRHGPLEVIVVDSAEQKPVKQ